MTFSVETRDGQVWLSGCVDTGNAVAVRQALEKMAAVWQDEVLVLNLSGVTSARSVVLSVLLRLMAACDKKGLQLRLESIPHRVFEMARVSGLDAVLPIDSIHKASADSAWQA